MSSETQKTEIPESRAAARSTLITLLFRLVSFGCTQATFRLLDPSTLGKASIQLELLLTTVLFISREGFRLALTRNISSENWNVAWLTIPTVSVVALGSLLWHLFFSTLSAEDPDYRMGGILYCLAAWIEGCAEPAVLYFLRQMNVAKRAYAESIATVAKTIATIIGLRSLDDTWHVTAFGTAQLVYSLVYTAILYSGAWNKLVAPELSSLDRSTCYMTLVFTVQGFFKHLLTEADRIVLTAVSSSYNQGVYAMGSSYGGMAARILLQPLEENARLLWSRLAGRKSIQELEQSYTVLVKLVLYIGLIFSCVAVNYTNLLLNILAGRKWGSNTEAAGVLSAFCVYTAFLACNGMTEAFVYGVATSGVEMGRLGMAHTLTGGVFAASAFFLVSKYGTVGLVAANCIAMSMRSIYSIYFAAKYFGERKSESVRDSIRRLLASLVPSPIILLGFALAWASTRWTLQRLQDENLHQVLDYRNKEWLYLTGQHLAMGITCVVGIASAAMSLESTFLRSLRSMVRSKQD
jgi:oligosaccharide translocation protein RFT1